MDFTAGIDFALTVLVSGYNERVALYPGPFFITLVPVGEIHLPIIGIFIPFELTAGIVFIAPIQLKIHLGSADGTDVFISTTVERDRYRIRVIGCESSPLEAVTWRNTQVARVVTLVTGAGSLGVLV